MSDNIVQQVIVPSYVWDDERQKGALLTMMGRAMNANAVANGWAVNLDDAIVEPHMLQAVVGHADVNGETISFVAYEKTTDPQACDLVMVMLRAAVA